MKPRPPQTAEHRALTRLMESELLQTYCSAFHLATGLKLTLCLAGDEEEPTTFSSGEQNRFCALVNGKGECSACRMAHADLLQHCADHAASVRCFAGMKESAVPVWMGTQVAAYLRFGQVLTSRPTEEQMENVMAVAAGLSPERKEELREAFSQTAVYDSKRYFGCVTLVSAFALQLTEELNRLVLAEAHCDPPAVVKAKQYVNAHLADPITLETVAAQAGISPYYLCKLFKQSAGMTLTEFVNRRRVEWAKRKLTNPQNRVTEVAFEVGYQSLSQFNRSFLRYAGESPTQFRERARARQAMES